ncbi:hypothetical protein DSECCO2_654610 [anaerobic digester metagenome]
MHECREEVQVIPFSAVLRLIHALQFDPGFIILGVQYLQPCKLQIQFLAFLHLEGISLGLFHHSHHGLNIFTHRHGVFGNHPADGYIEAIALISRTLLPEGINDHLL